MRPDLRGLLVGCVAAAAVGVAVNACSTKPAALPPGVTPATAPVGSTGHPVDFGFVEFKIGGFKTLISSCDGSGHRVYWNESGGGQIAAAPDDGCFLPENRPEVVR